MGVGGPQRVWPLPYHGNPARTPVTPPKCARARGIGGVLGAQKGQEPISRRLLRLRIAVPPLGIVDLRPEQSGARLGRLGAEMAGSG